MGARIVVSVLLLGGLLTALPRTAQAQKCDKDPDGAVVCFAKNAISSGLVTVPPGMSPHDYTDYAVGVSHGIQTPTATMFVLGISGAVADALPPTNTDGTPNQSAQNAAIDSILDAALRDGMVVLPEGTTSDQFKLMARQFTGAMAENSGVTISPGAVLKVLDSYVVASTSSTGSVDWPTVTTGISAMVDGLISADMLKLPSGIAAGNVKQFATDVSHAVYEYRQATRKARL